MIKISTKEIVDIHRYDDTKAIIVEKKPLADPSKFKAAYSVVDFENKTKDVLTKNAYLLKSSERISRQSAKQFLISFNAMRQSCMTGACL